jgi:hypothetical protein
MSNLHPKDNAFINSLKSYYMGSSSNTELSDIYNTIFNVIKTDSFVNMVNLFNMIHDKSPNIKGLENLFIQIIKKCRINSVEDLKTIATEHMYEFSQKCENTIVCYNDTPSYYEKLCYARFHYNIITPTLTLSDDDIIDMNDDYYTYYNDNAEENPYMKLEFAVYHILNIHETKQFDDWDYKYHLLYMNLLKLCFKRDDINLSKCLIKCVEPTALWISEHINSWLNKSLSGRYQLEIIEFINLFSNKYMWDILNSTVTISDKILDCITLFQDNLKIWFSETSPFNIYTKVSIINGSRYSRMWNTLENIELLIKFYIDLEKYNEYTGFDSRNSVRQHITYILFTYTSNIAHMKNILNNNTTLWYKFVVLLINQYENHIKFIENTARRFKDDIMSLRDLDHGNDSLIDMSLSTEAILICSNISIDISENKYIRYINFEIVLWLGRLIKVFTNIDVYDMIACFHNMTDVIRYSYFNEDCIHELFDTLIGGIVSCLEKETTNKIWDIYLSSNIDRSIHDKFINIMKEMNIVTITKYQSIMNELYQKNKTEDNIPNEFVDPMICEMIEDPVEIPITKVIMDEKIIYKHIILKEDNPFNRQRLSIEELNEYQEKEDVKFRIEEWKKSKSEWVESVSIRSKNVNIISNL